MSRPHVELIAAVGPNWELGLDGGMPWGRIKGNMALFARVTKGKAVVMGRKTWDSLPEAHRPLKGRHNVVISRSLARSEGDDVSIEAELNPMRWLVLEERKSNASLGTVIIGGGDIYRAALVADVVDVIHLSVIHPTPFEAWQSAARGWGSQAWAYCGAPRWQHDVTFPALDWRGWVVAARMTHPVEGGAPYGWTQLRLVRDPTHQALQDPDITAGVPLGWIAP